MLGIAVIVREQRVDRVLTLSSVLTGDKLLKRFRRRQQTDNVEINSPQEGRIVQRRRPPHMVLLQVRVENPINRVLTSRYPRRQLRSPRPERRFVFASREREATFPRHALINPNAK